MLGLPRAVDDSIHPCKHSNCKGLFGRTASWCFIDATRRSSLHRIANPVPYRFENKLRDTCNAFPLGLFILGRGSCFRDVVWNRLFDSNGLSKVFNLDVDDRHRLHCGVGDGRQVRFHD